MLCRLHEQPPAEINSSLATWPGCSELTIKKLWVFPASGATNIPASLQNVKFVLAKLVHTQQLPSSQRVCSYSLDLAFTSFGYTYQWLVDQFIQVRSIAETTSDHRNNPRVIEELLLGVWSPLKKSRRSVCWLLAYNWSSLSRRRI